MDLNLSANINKPDDFYEKLIDMQRDLSEDEVQMANAKLILILANHIGDQQIIDAAIKLARAA
jgi:hypothetical protein